MSRALVVMTILGAGCFSPRFTNDEIRCTVDGNCPRQYHCASATRTCYRDGQDPAMPDLASSPADLGAAPDLATAGDQGALADDTRTCAADNDCPANYYCTLVGTCFHDGAAPARCPRDALFCDDFEGHARLSWGAAASGGTVTAPAATFVGVDSSASFPGAAGASFHGSHALHAIAPGTSQQANATVYSRYLPYVLPAPLTGPATIALRAYVYAGRAPIEQPYFAYLHSAGQSDGFNVGSVNGSSTTSPTWSIYNKVAGNFTFNDSRSSAIATGHWYCVELVLDIDSANGANRNVTNFFVDNVLLNNSVTTGASASSAVGELDVGITWSQSSGDNELYIDDVAIAKQRIGCE